MKKIGKIISIILITTVFYTNPAQALMIDAATLIAKISEWVNKVNEATTKISQQVAQVKQMSSQGFNKKALAELAETYIQNYGSSLLEANKMEENVGSTKDKNKKAIEDERDLYKENRQQYSDEKITVEEHNLAEVTKLYQTTTLELNRKKIETEQKKKIYEQAIGTPQEEQAYNEYMTVLMEYERLMFAESELRNQMKGHRDSIKGLKEEKEKIGTNADPIYKKYQERIDALSANNTDANEDAFIGTVEAEEDDEWDKEKTMEKYELKEEDYENFMKYYFYDPSNLGNDTEYQTKIDAVIRNRRYLLINSAVHLLQVSATLRREIPVRTEVIDEMFQNTPQAPGELEAISSYSATKIENMKALLMYAKLQAARLQYVAARELQNVSVAKKKSEEDYSTFDLEKYILTKEYIDQAITEAETTNKELEAQLELKNKYEK